MALIRTNGPLTSEVSELTALAVSANYQTVTGATVGDIIIIVENASVTFTGASVISTSQSTASSITQYQYLVKATDTTITASASGGITSATKIS